MFEIEYKGANAVKIATKKTTIICDPALSVVGLKDITVKDVVELATENRFLVTPEAATLAIDGPGEYEIGDFWIRGIPARRHLDDASADSLSTVYRIEVGEVSVAVIGNIDPKLSEDQYEEIGLVDILIIPVGGSGYTLDATSAASITRHVEPKVVIPIHYNESGLTYEVPQDGVESFISELGVAVEEMAKYKLKGTASLPATLTVVKLERS